MRELHERILLHGAASLTDSELLGIVIDSEEVAQSLISQYTLTTLPVDDISRLRMSAGIGVAKATKIIASVELARRIAKSKTEVVDRIQSCEEAEKVLRPLFDGLDHEECWALYLTNSGKVLDKMKISQGGVQATVVDNRLIVKRALELLATQIIIGHNHPSENAQPSQADIVLTNRIKNAAALFDITLLDHIIITRTNSYSFKKFGLLDR
ncbi:MAG: DNA repair protein RadC [Rikenellaceae bacterium]|nr:DNA repair protein RadC [Rikenellaceae bacterium]